MLLVLVLVLGAGAAAALAATVNPGFARLFLEPLRAERHMGHCLAFLFRLYCRLSGR